MSKGMSKGTIIGIVVAVIAVFSILFGNTGPKSDLKVTLVTDAGTVDDKSFNEAAWDAVQEFAKETGADANFIEPQGDDQIQTGLEDAVAAGANVVVAPGFKFVGNIEEVAIANPEVKFILLDAVPASEDKIDNIVSYLYHEEHAGYLAGAMAGVLTETNKIGFIGGESIPPVQNFATGFIQGVKLTNADATVKVVYADDFGDVAKGTQIANSMMNEDIDVIHSAAGGVGIGAMNAIADARAEDKDVWHVGVDIDQYETQPDANIFSAVKGLATSVNEALAAYEAGNFDELGGEVIILGHAENGADVAYDNPLFNGHAKKDAMLEAYETALESIENVENFETAPILENGIY